MNSFLIIYCHPYQKSLNHAVLQAVENNLSQKQIQYTIIDLYQEKFQPIYDLEELRLLSLLLHCIQLVSVVLQNRKL